jgi:hypothetical protein
MFSFIMFPSFFPSPHRRLHFSLGRYDLACPCIAPTFTLLSSRGGNPTGFSTRANIDPASLEMASLSQMHTPISRPTVSLQTVL